MQLNDEHLKALLAKGIPKDAFNVDFTAQKDWLRLTLPLKVGDTILGFWFLGKRDPDDLYPQVEIPILQSLADQTAIALSNILQTEQLLKLYQSDIKRVEQERQNLAHELHDRRFKPTGAPS